MQNPIQLPYPFSSFNLASVFDLSTLNNANSSQQHSHQIHNNNNNNNNNGSLVMDPIKSPTNLQTTFDEAVSHFLFPSTFFSGHHTFYPRNNNTSSVDGCSENYNSENIFMKRANVNAGNSFSIDSLLGINNVIQSGIVPTAIKEQNHHRLNLISLGYGTNKSINNNGLNLSQPFSKSEQLDYICENNMKRRKNLNSANNNNNNNIHYSASKMKLTNNNNSNSDGDSYKIDASKYHQQIKKSSSSCTNPNNNILCKNKSKANKSNNYHSNCKGTDSEKFQEPGNNGLRRTTKIKRVRTIFTPEQLERLEAEFERQQYMVGPERLFLASSLNLTEAQVKVWFQNRRIKWRKQHLELQQQRLAVIRSKQQNEIEDEEDDNEFDSRSSDFGSSIDSPTTTIISSNHNISMESNINILNYSSSTVISQQQHQPHPFLIQDSQIDHHQHE